MKYPNAIDASVSSSGPILYFKGRTSEEAFNVVVT